MSYLRLGYNTPMFITQAQHIIISILYTFLKYTHILSSSGSLIFIHTPVSNYYNFHCHWLELCRDGHSILNILGFLPGPSWQVDVKSLVLDFNMHCHKSSHQISDIIIIIILIEEIRPDIIFKTTLIEKPTNIIFCNIPVE